MRAVLTAALLLGACATQPVPAVTPATRIVRPAAPPAAVNGAWSFSTGAGSCVARVGQGPLALTIRALPGTVSFQPQPAGATSFAGPGGSWRLRRDEIGAAQPMDRALPRLRAVLGGGVLTAEGRRLAPLRVPDASTSGRDWFGCLEELGGS